MNEPQSNIETPHEAVALPRPCSAGFESPRELGVLIDEIEQFFTERKQSLAAKEYPGPKTTRKGFLLLSEMMLQVGRFLQQVSPSDICRTPGCPPGQTGVSGHTPQPQTE